MIVVCVSFSKRENLEHHAAACFACILSKLMACLSSLWPHTFARASRVAGVLISARLIDTLLTFMCTSSNPIVPQSCRAPVSLALTLCPFPFLPDPV